MKLSDETCPVDFVPVNEHKVKIVALQVFLLSTFFAIVGNPLLIFILAADFLLRSLGLSLFSPLSIIAGFLVNILRIDNVPIDAGPKKFAARMGLTFTLLIIAFWYTGFYKTSVAFAIIISLFSLLESSVGFCIGCHIYSFSKNFFNTSRSDGQRYGS